MPVFVSLNNKFKSIGYDIDENRVKSLNNGIDTNNEFNKKSLILKNKSKITSNENNLKKCNFYIITVPTPVGINKLPDLKYIVSACKTISKYIKKDDIIFLESTVFPGTTEEICKKILKRNINFKFHIGYSSERINPGDKIHNIKNISKVVSINSNRNVVSRVKKVYSSLSKKIIFTKKVKEAELSKLIENTQRDLNIALMNELMVLCHKTDLNFDEVIRLARSKWNFLDFSPGLVGGHCLPVDPYYLSYYANKSNFKTKVTLAGRDVNNSMELFIFNKIYKKISKIKNIKKKRIIFSGLTYKPNVADLRNSIPIKIYKKLKTIFPNLIPYEPILNKKIAKRLNIEVEFKNIKKGEVFIILVKHTKFKNLYSYVRKNNKLLIDPFL